MRGVIDSSGGRLAAEQLDRAEPRGIHPQGARGGVAGLQRNGEFRAELDQGEDAQHQDQARRAAVGRSRRTGGLCPVIAA
ncbi:hypothetical protein [Ancylobacter vacuolatus]|uniref:hypothetical protein n=1 Tax=Ancylobacter vacuolatus TaxID=223389 RepID=UPI003520861D